MTHVESYAMVRRAVFVPFSKKDRNSSIIAFVSELTKTNPEISLISHTHRIVMML